MLKSDKYYRLNLHYDHEADVKVGIYWKPSRDGDVPMMSGVLDINGEQFQLYDAELVGALIKALSSRFPDVY